MSFKKTQALRSRRHGTISLNEDHIEGEEVIQSKAYQAWSLMSLKASWTLALRFPTPRQISGSCLLSPKLEIPTPMERVDMKDCVWLWA